MSSIEQAVINFLPILLYAVAGAWDGANKGEKVDYMTFAKTLIVGGVTAGLISQSNADLLTQVASSAVVGAFVDKLLNAVINKFERTVPKAVVLHIVSSQPPAPPAPDSTPPG